MPDRCGTSDDRNVLYRCQTDDQNKAIWSTPLNCADKSSEEAWVCTLCGLRPMNSDAKQTATCMPRALLEEYSRMPNMVGCDLAD